MQGDNQEFVDIGDKSISYFIRCEHLARYIYASEQLRKRKARCAIDAACGSGYGSVELAKYVDKVISFDKNPPSDKYQKANIQYIQTDLNSADFTDQYAFQKKIDAVTCFETLEHLSNPKSFLLSLAHVLKNNGLLFVSVPDGNFEKTDENNKLVNPYHLHKFTENQMKSLVAECGFETKRVLYQPVSAQLYRNEARALRDLKLDEKFAQKMSPDVSDMHYYSRIYAWPDENKGQSYSLMFMCEKIPQKK